VTSSAKVSLNDVDTGRPTYHRLLTAEIYTPIAFSPRKKFPDIAQGLGVRLDGATEHRDNFTFTLFYGRFSVQYILSSRYSYSI